MIAVLHRTLRRCRDSDGFSLPEVLTAVVITMALSAAITAVILASMQLLTGMQINAARSAVSQTALNTLTTTLRDAERVTTADTATLVYQYQRDRTCEQHTYTIENDPTNTGRRQLRHTVVAVTLVDATCGDITATQWNAGATTITVELTNLAPAATGFTYTNSVGQTISTPVALTSCPTRPGRPARPAYADVMGVTATFDTYVDNTGSTTSAADQATVTVRANGMGLSCA